MKAEITLIIAVASLSLFSTGCRTDSNQAPNEVATATGLNPDDPGLEDSRFASQTLCRGAGEMDLSRLGVDRSQNPDLKLLAQRIFDDHSRADDDLRIIIRQQGIPISSELDQEDDVASLQRLSGSNFDRMFIHHLMETRREEIKNFKAAARNARNSDLREFASRGLPVLEEHLRIAENIAKNVGLDLNVNEPAGANRTDRLRDPYYGGDPQQPHQFNPVTPLSPP
ncbi:MAG: hypothetical protein JWM68_4342 [Verrucomicrobiales bacterium]|nr:hypothetical protein [Verrucomicrobiales bacterium]